MSEEIKEYPFEKTFDVKFDENALKNFNDLIKEKGIRHFKLESDLYGILDVVLYEEYQDLQQKVEQLEKDFKETNDLALNLISKNKQLENIIKEAIDFCKKYDFILKWQLLDILNKGSE